MPKIITSLLAICAAFVLAGCPEEICHGQDDCTEGYACTVDKKCVPADPLTIDTAALPDAVVGEAYEHPFEASGGFEPYTWSIVTDEWPSMEASTGRLSGTPTAAAEDLSFVVRVTDNSYGNGMTVSKTFSLGVGYCTNQPHQCSDRGTCDGGTCVCDEGYEGYAGTTCETCAAEYHREGDECVVDRVCDVGTCSGRGDCDDSTGIAVCTCDDGYAGEHCTECAPGYHQVDQDGCVKDQVCLDNTCTGHGDCDDSTGVVVCTCNRGYAGEFCETCEAGFHDEGDQCIWDTQCPAVDPCSGHGDCDDSTGVVVCTCDVGYEGDLCERCSSDFHEEQGECVTDVVFVAGGGSHSCALLANGKVRCWGSSYYGQLGYGNTDHIGDNEQPYEAGDVNVGGTVVSVVAGGNHTCTLLDNGKVRCWGRGEYGQLGYGNTDNIGDNEQPYEAGDVNVGGTVVSIAAGYDHTCVLLDNGKVRCWGRGEYGRLGYGNTDNIGDNEQPYEAGDVNVGGTVVFITAGGRHTCALLDTGRVRCWGSGVPGQLGYGNTDDIGDNEQPYEAGDVNIDGTVVSIEAGFSHTCALLGTGRVRCWGFGMFGQLGYGNTDHIGDNEQPYEAGDVNVGGTVVSITTGYNHTCALLDTGRARCWGRSAFGQLGYCNTDHIGDNEQPYEAGDVNVGGTVVSITAGDEHTCALLDTGRARCWGRGGSGQLGYGSIDDIGDDEYPADVGDVQVY